MIDPTQPRRRKRSRAMALTGAMAGAGFSISACDEPPTNWSQVSTPEPVPAVTYMTTAECKIANEVPDEECDKAWQAAQLDDQKSGPRYDDRGTCEDVYGAGNCVPKGSGSGGSYFGPLLTGFLIGQMLDSGGRPYYRGTGAYREDGYQGSGGYVTSWGGRLNRDYSTGRTTIDRAGVDPPPAVRQAPPKVQSRTTVVSRSGFGGGRSSGG